MHSSEGNFFDIPQDLPVNFELFQTVISTDDLSIERIISTGQKTPADLWLEQDKNEWVILLQGTAEMEFEKGLKKELSKGDYIFIPKNTKHRVNHTSSDPPCIWLAIHY
jgi:cupin 2 domain-containing protein